MATPLNYSCDSSSYELAEGLAHCWSELKKDWLINAQIAPTAPEFEHFILEYKPEERGILIELSSKRIMSYLNKERISFLGDLKPNILLVMITGSGEILDDHSLFSLWRAQAQSKGFNLDIPLWDLNEQVRFNSKEVNGIKSKELEHLFDHYDADLICLVRIHEQYIVIKSFNNNIIPEYRIKRDKLEDLTEILVKTIHDQYDNLHDPQYYQLKAQRNKWILKDISSLLKQVAELDDLHLTSMFPNELLFKFKSIWPLATWKRFLKKYPGIEVDLLQ